MFMIWPKPEESPIALLKTHIYSILFFFSKMHNTSELLILHDRRLKLDKNIYITLLNVNKWKMEFPEKIDTIEIEIERLIQLWS